MKRTSSSPACFLLASLIAVSLLTCTVSAQVNIFSENFDTDHSLDDTWITNSVGGYNPVDLYFDYSTVGIPSAPNSTGGTTRGLKLQANLDTVTAVFPSGCSVSPAGFSISSNFEMRWDWWLNFNGSPTTGLTGGGSGSTQIGGAGFGTAATTANVPTIIDAVFVGCSGDGTGTSADYRMYTPAFSASLQDASGVYAAGTVGSRNNTHAYYQSTFPPVSATNTCPDQLALYPGTQFGLTQGGSAGMKWHDISLKKIGNIITYTIDGLLIATADISTNGTLGGANIVFGHFDINSGVSTDPNRTNLAFSLVDNVRVTSFTNVITIAAVSPSAAESGPSSATFTLTRSASGFAQTVNYSIAGTASNGTDYTNALGGALSGTVTFAASDTDTNVTIVPIDDAVSEATESVVLSILPGLYVGAGSATATITDNDPQLLTITSVSTQMYERTNDYATFRITRLGDLNAASYTVNLSFAGTAANDVDYALDPMGTFDPGMETMDLKVRPIEDAAFEGNEIVTLNIAAAGGGEYGIGTPGSASITLVDATSPPATLLFSENFDTADSGNNWNVFVTGSDNTVQFGFDYSSQGIPSAPHGSGDTFGVYMAVNKSAGTATAVNLYPIGQSFSGNYALRFDMLLNLQLPNAVSTEYVLFGLNHSGTLTNWFRNSPGGVPAGWSFDGVFYGIEADGAGLGDYANYSSPTTAGNNPTALTAGRSATTLTNEFKVPPFAAPGVPANNLSLASPTPIWADVELSQIGKIITLKVNNTTIMSYSNATPYAAGNVMIGYDDAYDSVSLNTSYVVIDNLRVVRLNGLDITAVKDLGANMQLDFSFDLNDVPAAFKVQTAAAVTGAYADATATIVQLSPGSYRATVAKSGSAQFFRIRHN